MFDYMLYTSIYARMCINCMDSIIDTLLKVFEKHLVRPTCTVNNLAHT